MSAINRQRAILNSLPTLGNGLTANEILQRLDDNTDHGAVNIRTIQRDLQSMKLEHEIDCVNTDDGNRWRWREGYGPNKYQLDERQAIAILMIEKHLAMLLPPSQLSGMQQLFDKAKLKLQKISNTKKSQLQFWMDKVFVVSPTYPLIQPQPSDKVLQVVYESILDNKQFYGNYAQAHKQGKTLAGNFHAHGLIMRGSRIYVVATCATDNNQEKSLRQYALHRFSSAEKTNLFITTPDNLNLKDEIENKGFTEFGNKGKITLIARCNHELASRLAESPLSKDQTQEVIDENFVKVTATVNDTWQLKFWILEQGYKLQVLEPKELRNEVLEDIRKSLALYNDI